MSFFGYFANKSVHDFIKDGKIDEVIDMLNKNPKRSKDINEDGISALHCACVSDQMEAVGVLISRGADIEVRDIEGQSPLHYSSRLGREHIVGVLLSQGAHVNGKDKWGSTALHFACTWNHQSIALLLVQNGARITTREKVSTKTEPSLTSISKIVIPPPLQLLDKSPLDCAVAWDSEFKQRLQVRETKPCHADGNRNVIAFLPFLSPEHSKI